MTDTPTPHQDVYTLAEFAKKVRISVDQARDHVSGILPPQLVPIYSGSKPLVTEAERQRWLSALPKEPTRRSIRAERAS